MNFDNLFQNSTGTNTPSSSQNLMSGLEQSLVKDGESILEHAAVGVVAGLI